MDTPINKRPMLVVMRAANMHRVHPQTDFTHACERCKELVGIYPSGQRALREYLDIEIVCDVCLAKAEKGMIEMIALPGVEKEMRESVDFTRKKHN